MLLLGAETHDPLHVGPVVPTAIKENNLSCGWEMRHVTLEIPLGELSLRRLGQSNDFHVPGAASFSDPLDHTAFARRSATFEDNQHAETPLDYPILKLDKLLLEPGQFRLIETLLESATLFVVLFAGWGTKNLGVVDLCGNGVCDK